MIERQKLSRGIKSRLVSTDTSGISFLTPIDNGVVMRSNSGARHATGGMFRDLRNISNDLPDRPEKIKWPLGARSSDALEDTVMKSMREEVASLKVVIQKLETENVCYRDQRLSCAQEPIQHAMCSDFSTQTDVHDALHQTLAEKAVIIEILKNQICNLQSELGENLERNKKLIERNNILQSQYDENTRLLDFEKEVNKNQISNMAIMIEKQSRMSHVALPIVIQEPSFLSQSTFLDLNNCTIIFQKFRNDHKSHQKSIAKTLALLDKDFLLMKSDVMGKLKSVFQDVTTEYEKKMKEKDEELIDISSHLIKSNESLSAAVTFGEKKSNDFISILMCLNKATDYLSEIMLKHNSLIQSVLHDAHIKDLARISALRESTLERDKVTNDLEFCRDVVNIISFSLKTAELTLIEDHPDVHSKLVSGRVDKLKELQIAANEKQKNIDLRSLEICSLNTSRLDDFQLKAKEKVLAETFDFSALMESFRIHLDFRIPI